jgi:hypothetical protein
MQKFGRERAESGHRADTLDVQPLTHFEALPQPIAALRKVYSITSSVLPRPPLSEIAVRSSLKRAGNVRMAKASRMSISALSQ